MNQRMGGGKAARGWVVAYWIVGEASVDRWRATHRNMNKVCRPSYCAKRGGIRELKREEEKTNYHVPLISKALGQDDNTPGVYCSIFAPPPYCEIYFIVYEAVDQSRIIDAIIGRRGSAN